MKETEIQYQTRKVLELHAREQFEKGYLSGWADAFGAMKNLIRSLGTA